MSLSDKTHTHIGVAPITQLGKYVIKKLNIQGGSPNVAKVISMP